jgi:zinc D-Ala-D-Ala carboxypeptidase
MKLTEHFFEEELGVAGADERVVRNAKALCERVLEPIRQRFGAVHVHSGYRSPKHNRSVGGKKDSWHLYEGGHAAADFHVEGVELEYLFGWMRLLSRLPFDKVILERKDGAARCIHVQMDCEAEPRRLAFSGSTGDGKVYMPEVVA